MKLPKVAENDAEGVFRMCPKFGPVPLMELLCQLMCKHSLSGVISWLDIGRRQDLMRARRGSN